jgi:hypothetical protein
MKLQDWWSTRIGPCWRFFKSYVFALQKYPKFNSMSADPVAITLADSAASAAALLRNRGLKVLPVLTDLESRRPAGYVRAETLMHTVIGGLRSGGESHDLCAAMADWSLK